MPGRLWRWPCLASVLVLAGPLLLADLCDGTDPCPAGEACETGLEGVCAAGTFTLQGATLDCVQDNAAATEICDGLDNDCDGDTDEDDICACGGLDGCPCLDDQDCLGGLFCRSLLQECGGPGLCAVVPVAACPPVDEPVCGCDGRTYANDCEARAARQALATDTSCAVLCESCDPPGSTAGQNGNLCAADCTVCGDGFLDAGELCDDGNGINEDNCRNDCTFPVCGDLILDATESCDPPGAPAGAVGLPCRVDCTVCGDGILDPGEECDDGNADGGDACSTACAAAPSGEVPAGSLILTREPSGSITLTWGSSCVSTDGDYAIYQGMLGQFSSHVAIACTTGGLETTQIQSSATDAYYFVVPRSGGREGSYGRSRDGSERSPGLSSCAPQKTTLCGT